MNMTPPRRALIVVDVQQDYFAGPLEVQFPPHAQSLPRITAVIDAARKGGIPIVAVQHRGGDGSPVFDPATAGFDLHPEVESRLDADVKRVTKEYGTVFGGTDLLAWLRDQAIDTISLVGYMTNNCILASAAEAETHGLTAEVLSDATGAIHLANAVGFADAQTVHATLMTLLHSNFAAVAPTIQWLRAVEDGVALDRDNLVQSARAGAERARRR